MGIEILTSGDIYRIKKVLDGYMEPSTLDEALKNIPEDDQLGVIRSVADRLDLYGLLQEIKGIGLDLHHENLCIYLLLTCYDMMGYKKGNYLHFNDWLQASRTKNERDEAIKEIIGRDNLIEQCKIIHRFYLDIYGHRRSFYNFIDNILPDASQKKLLDSIEIIYYYSEEKAARAPINEKKAYLFEIRNLYTHRGEYYYGVSLDLRDKMEKGFESKDVMRSRGFEKTGEYEKHIYVKQWPELLEETVKVGLAEYIRQD